MEMFELLRNEGEMSGEDRDDTGRLVRTHRLQNGSQPRARPGTIFILSK